MMEETCCYWTNGEICLSTPIRHEFNGGFIYALLQVIGNTKEEKNRRRKCHPL